MTTSPTRDWPALETHLRTFQNEFEVDPTLIHLNAMVVATPPKRVRERIEAHRDGMKPDPDGYILHQQKAGDYTRVVRECFEAANAAAKYMGLETYLKDRGVDGSAVIAQTTSTTMGLGLLANGITAKPGQEVLTSFHEFPASRTAWKLRCDRTSLRYREIRLYSDTTLPDLDDLIVKTIVKEIRERTRVLALTWVDSGTGVKLPIKRIADHVRQINLRRAPGDCILFCVDGVHGFGVENVSFEELGCDFLVAGCHKWIFGPRGTGIICALPAAWAQVTPTIPSFLGGAARPGFYHTPGGIGAYEHAWAVCKAFEFHIDMTKDAVQQHTHGLATRLKQGLAGVPKVRVITPVPEHLSSGIVCCEVPAPAKAKEDLRALGVLAMTSSDADGKPYLRFSPSLLNDDAQIAAALKAVASVV